MLMNTEVSSLALYINNPPHNHDNVQIIFDLYLV